MDRQIGMGEITPEYQAFIDKFKPKLTTDDCYTPENIYKTVRDWVLAHYELPEDTPVVRPFWPGADYKLAEYPQNCVVIDNPPFSILSEIERWYLDNGIRFFLFAPGLTLFKSHKGLNYVITGEKITYQNGAEVNTSFVTNMGDYLIETSPELTEIIKKGQKKTKDLPKYVYPMEVVTAGRLKWLAEHGTQWRLKAEDAIFTRKLDNQGDKTIYGGGYLISATAAAERAAAERGAAERAGAIVWELSPRERAIIDRLGR